MAPNGTTALVLVELPLELKRVTWNGKVVSMALDLCVEPDAVNRHKQTALMLAAMHGRTECVRRLLDAGANILMFDSSHGRTCLHYAAYYGHSDCLRAILTAARTAPVSQSWGYARFVNVRDDTGATPLHLAARQGWRRCVHVLLENGAIVSASSGAFGFPGSTPLHLAARGGSLDCVRQLLSWGADRLQRDSVGRIPYEVAVKRGHVACAALLTPSSAEPLVWPSPLKFISELEPDAKALLEAALMEANREREKRILKGAKNSLPSPSRSDDGATVSEGGEVCSICFDQACAIEEAMSVHIALRRSREDSARPTDGSVRRDSIVSAQRALGSSETGSSRSQQSENLSFPITGRADYESHRERAARRGKEMIRAAEARITAEMAAAEAADAAARAAAEE
ncbi:E3 ubiquitin-protein ligase XB3 [Triticum urartu]|uniref:E3 ubiquitin-protein ligase XB3 n=1 Tax=Triticum urartu TaxID=4572 RepID=M7ZJH2_TRIUA|nr:E3 ubiquitin-protein ligase XB3 [Triticum urartu]